MTVEIHSSVTPKDNRVVHSSRWYRIGPYGKDCRRTVARQQLDITVNRCGRLPQGQNAETFPRTGGGYVLTVDDGGAGSLHPIPTS